MSEMRRDAPPAPNSTDPIARVRAMQMSHIPPLLALSGDGVDTHTGPQAPDRDYIWQDDAACKDVDTDVFFPDDANVKDSIATAKATAKAICRACIVKGECLTYALKTGQKDGIWGGTTESERERIKRQRRHAARRRDAI